jgi:diadenosine tetraphosphate (Ap4A) HIT family hydrolase
VRVSCPFCTLPAERIVAQDDLTCTLRDAYPVSPGHTLIITRRHIASMAQATVDEQHALLGALAIARNALDSELRPDGYNLGINDGLAAGQTIMHLHLHLIPRYTGDTPRPRGGVRHCIPGKGDYVAR